MTLTWDNQPGGHSVPHSILGGIMEASRDYVYDLDRRITLLRNEALVLRKQECIANSEIKSLAAGTLRAELREYLCDFGMDNRAVLNH